MRFSVKQPRVSELIKTYQEIYSVVCIQYQRKNHSMDLVVSEIRSDRFFSTLYNFLLLGANSNDQIRSVITAMYIHPPR